MSAKIIKNFHCYSVFMMNLFFRVFLSIAKNGTTTDEFLPFRHPKAFSICLFVRNFQLANYLLYLSVQTGISKYKV